ncbi:MAG: glutamine--tRNA ligase/YqeY domain fusion protein [Eubacteriaceae bacterium]|nr:glutamine--tRNA ligase/YqeY domain fusion protein [Eubacteriaceae bacterium]
MSSNFIFNEIDKDIENGIYLADEIKTRFPPEPNGYLHVGHAKALYINFAVKEKYNATTYLRYDDTNPAKEDIEYTEAIQEDIAWLGFKWDQLLFASDYFETMYEHAIELINKGLAFIDDQTSEEIRSSRGSLVEKGTESPWRNRSIEDNLKLFREMREGKHEAGSRVLRAKIDMSSPNMNMRDPVLYRILFESHPHTNDEWCIYPMYDYAHPIEDAIEKITHSLCSMEYEDHRPLYDWVLDNIDAYKEKRPRQIEFARLAIKGALTSKRNLKKLVDNNIVDGWDDPRLYTLRGLRRRGVSAQAIRNFCAAVGVAKANSEIPREQLDYYVREDLGKTAKRIMAVVNPLKLTVTNYPEGQIEILDVPNDTSDPDSETRQVAFGRDLYIEADDFEQNPPKGYHRLYPGNEVRLMGAYFVKCTGAVVDADGNVLEVLCEYDPETKSGSGFTARKVKGTIHWVESTTALPIETRQLGELLDPEKPSGDVLERLNSSSLERLDSFAEKSLEAANPSDTFQFVRLGYYCADSTPGVGGKMAFNRTVELKSTWKPEKA